MVNDATKDGQVSGKFSKIACEIERKLSTKKPIPMNIDGATAVIYAELGCPPPLARGLFCIYMQNKPLANGGGHPSSA